VFLLSGLFHDTSLRNPFSIVYCQFLGFDPRISGGSEPGNLQSSLQPGSPIMAICFPLRYNHRVCLHPSALRPPAALSFARQPAPS